MGVPHVPQEAVRGYIREGEKVVENDGRLPPLIFMILFGSSTSVFQIFKAVFQSIP